MVGGSDARCRDPMSVELGRAFLEQAQADLELLQQLQTPDVPECYRVHQLRLATENLAKAYRAAAGATLGELRQSHVTFAKLADILTRCPAIWRSEVKKHAVWRAYVGSLRAVAEEIERLIPRKGYDGPTAEYPWARGDEYVAPRHHDYRAELALYHERKGRDFVKVLRRLAEDEHWQAALGIPPQAGRRPATASA